MHKFTFLVGAATMGALVQMASAQTVPALPQVDTTAVDKAVEAQRKPARSSQTAKKVSNAVPEDLSGFSVELLKEVQVSGILLNREVSDYWLPYLRKPVTAAQMLEFKKWVYARMDEAEVLGFLQVKEDKSPQGSTLVVEVVPLTVGKITVLVNDPELGQKYSTDVVTRFTSRFKTGEVLDVATLDAQLNAAAYDLPVALDVSLYPVGRSADIVINMAAAPYGLGRVQSASVQVNNYGLTPFGRTQGLAVVSVDGFTPLSTATLGAMASEHVAYFRGQYELPLVGTGTRIAVWGSANNLNTTSGVSKIEGATTEYGLRLAGLVGVTGKGNNQWALELARVDESTKAGGIEYVKSNNQQLRLRLNSYREVGSTGALSNAFTLTLGVLDLSGNAGNLGSDQSTYQTNGNYQKLEIAGGYSTKLLSTDDTITGSVRWRGQLASKNLSTYNQIALGGTNGIRAYNTADGVGDEGAVLSFDLTKEFMPEFRVGVLYDVGRVNKYKNPNYPGSTSTADNGLVLQGAGLQFGGTIANFNWNASAAKSFGTGQSILANDTTLTPVGDWRVNLEVNRGF